MEDFLTPQHCLMQVGKQDNSVLYGGEAQTTTM